MSLTWALKRQKSQRQTGKQSKTKTQAKEASNNYLQFVFKNVLDELGHDRLRAAEDLAHLLVDPLTEECRVLKHIVPEVRPLKWATRVEQKGRKYLNWRADEKNVRKRTHFLALLDVDVHTVRVALGDEEEQDLRTGTQNWAVRVVFAWPMDSRLP